MTLLLLSILFFHSIREGKDNYSHSVRSQVPTTGSSWSVARVSWQSLIAFSTTSLRSEKNECTSICLNGILSTCAWEADAPAAILPGLFSSLVSKDKLNYKEDQWVIKLKCGIIKLNFNFLIIFFYLRCRVPCLFSTWPSQSSLVALHHCPFESAWLLF